ncbi:hypothetical protein BRPE64_BCDS02060 [Caballeronia insecticola]|uniref:Uncharacterized protein n=1 Tax=Caballeronia insecticola TaxID=758793 RepID=R4X1A7_9BURK|nr:hypothetical protein BRPE64_BCDS02060 [Caballeronia insecticola]
MRLRSRGFYVCARGCDAAPISKAACNLTASRERSLAARAAPNAHRPARCIHHAGRYVTATRYGNTIRINARPDPPP